MGSGWVYGIINPESDFKILGASIRNLELDEEHARYYTDVTHIIELVNNANTLIMHNAQYDFGCLLYLMSQQDFDIDLYNKNIIDTKVMSVLHDSSKMSHSLDNIGKDLFNETKDFEVLRTAAYKENLKPWTQAEIVAKKRARKKEETYIRKRPSDAILYRLAIQNLDKLPDEVVGQYCNQDVGLTVKVYNYYKDVTESYLVSKYSNLAKVCCKNRLRGVLIDEEATGTVHGLLGEKQKNQEEKVHSIANTVFNIHSSAETVDVLTRSGVQCPKTEKGNPSATTPWLEKRAEPLCEAIVEARQSYKILNDFVIGVQVKCQSTGNGHLYPELNILQARTGRFSCTGPNIQQIPADKEYGKLCRSFYTAGKDNLFHSLDYSNQEGRLQLHYAVALGLDGADRLAELAKDPKWDMHLTIAQLIWGKHITKDSKERKAAKAINLGLSYGMGRKKLALQLGMRENDSAIHSIVEDYHEAAPYLKQLINYCTKKMRERGYIKTIGGRRLTLDPPTYYNGTKQTFEYKALNKLIQGSAADQTIQAMIQADEEGLPVLFPVHDELCMVGTMFEAIRLQEIMETCVPLKVPVVVTHNHGKNWGECK